MECPYVQLINSSLPAHPAIPHGLLLCIEIALLSVTYQLFKFRVVIVVPHFLSMLRNALLHHLGHRILLDIS